MTLFGSLLLLCFRNDPTHSSFARKPIAGFVKPSTIRPPRPKLEAVVEECQQFGKSICYRSIEISIDFSSTTSGVSTRYYDPILQCTRGDQFKHPRLRVGQYFQTDLTSRAHRSNSGRNRMLPRRVRIWKAPAKLGGTNTTMLPTSRTVSNQTS